MRSRSWASRFFTGDLPLSDKQVYFQHSSKFSLIADVNSCVTHFLTFHLILASTGNKRKPPPVMSGSFFFLSETDQTFFNDYRRLLPACVRLLLINPNDFFLRWGLIKMSPTLILSYSDVLKATQRWRRLTGHDSSILSWMYVFWIRLPVFMIYV